MTESKLLHEHEVLKMMLLFNQVYTKCELKNAFTDRFGAEARFYNCTHSRLTADELIANLDREGHFLLINQNLFNLMDSF
ncbi:MAG: hypothetical protein CR997_05925 [Acidobacteria bacterium]|nr:MAG: hypothetical protein CR997_05925 [Acidobacteriota bacterium]